MNILVKPKEAPVIPLTAAPTGRDMSWATDPLVEAKPEVWTEFIEADDI